MKLRQLEFWIGTLLVTIALSATLAWMNGEGQVVMIEARHNLQQSGRGFNYVFNFFLPHILPALIYYGGFLAVIFIGSPRYLEARRFDAFITFMLVLLVLLTAFFTFNAFCVGPDITTEYANGNLMVYYLNRGLMSAFKFLIGMGFYLLIRELVIPRLMSLKNRSVGAQAFFTHLQVFVFLWVPVIASIFFVRRSAVSFMLYVAFCAFPLAFLIHALNFAWLIPYKERQRLSWWKYWGIYILATFALTLPAVFVFSEIVESRTYQDWDIFWASYIWIILLVTPFTWILYVYGRKTSGRLNQLASALSTSNANLDFLKSQINPHFLFNALNTLYGTAIQEHSENTAQGIQQLGDMMRFMLYDNMQDSIPLVKEIQYMRNYIDLQKLRTQASDKIRIDTQLDEAACQHSVAPMLLIPFVENAFKHGISLIRPSWIKVSLTCTPDKVYFDVYNSRHPSPEKDPEASNSGIGLENVRRRLQLLYPGRHELSIHESATEYFIHLTLLFPHGKK